MTRHAAWICLGTLFVASALADVIEVPADFPTIQQAIDASVDADEIVVSPGVYVENLSFLDKDVLIRSLDPADPTIVAATVADGDSAGTVVTMNVSVQSSALAIVVVNSPPAPSENTTTPAPWESPNDSPSMMTVLPTFPEGFVALLTKLRTGATAVNAAGNSIDDPSTLLTVTLTVESATTPAGTVVKMVSCTRSAVGDWSVPTNTVAPNRKFDPTILSSVPTVPVEGVTLAMVGSSSGPTGSSPPQPARNAPFRTRGARYLAGVFMRHSAKLLLGR